jgi:hypothetical protein
MNTNELLPIIRRVRRPLVTMDAPPVVVGNVEPVKVEAVPPVEPVEKVAPALVEPVTTLPKPAKKKNAKGAAK